MTGKAKTDSVVSDVNAAKQDDAASRHVAPADAAVASWTMI
jgi:hypothetical protein